VIVQALAKVINHTNLTESEMSEVMEEITSGSATPSQIGAFLTGLRMKGETVEEITVAARIMRNKVRPLKVSHYSKALLIDTCGTGGDQKQTFNISTIAALVIAGTGVKVAKHGNRSVSSSFGSADLMQALDVNIDVPIKIIEECIEQVGFGFLYAPLFHSAMKYVATIRKEIGIRTIFNLLGPLTNPAMATAQLVGVYDATLTETFAYVLKNLGCTHALIVHGYDGLDEITTTGKTKITELIEKEVKTYYIHPTDFGMKTGTIEELKAADMRENVSSARRVLSGRKGTQRDIVLLNSAAGLIAAGKAKDFIEGIEIAMESIDSGKAMNVLQELVRRTGGKSL
jgi:anthranilate phosphoribosyltransferase